MAEHSTDSGHGSMTAGDHGDGLGERDRDAFQPLVGALLVGDPQHRPVEMDSVVVEVEPSSWAVAAKFANPQASPWSPQGVHCQLTHTRAVGHYLPWALLELFMTPAFSPAMLRSSRLAPELLQQDPCSARAVRKSQCAYISIISGMLFVVFVLLLITFMLVVAPSYHMGPERGNLAGVGDVKSGLVVLEMSSAGLNLLQWKTQAPVLLDNGAVIVDQQISRKFGKRKEEQTVGPRTGNT